MFFDCECILGKPPLPMTDITPDLPDLLNQMSKLHIDKALVRSRVCLSDSAELGNQVLLKDINGHDNLIPAFFVTNDGLHGEWKPGVMVDSLLSSGAKAAWVQDPYGGIPYILETWCAGEMLDALQQHKVPLMLNASQVSPGILHDLLTDFPTLPVILLQVPRMGRIPHVYRLMQLHTNLHICVGASYGVHLGIEDLVNNFGSSRLIFGSGYPTPEGGMPVAMLMYAQISDADKAAIASANMERLISEVLV